MNSFFGWIGGKRALRKDITALFPSNIEKYIEVLGGAARFCYINDRHAKTEVYNDINNDLVNLFRCVKHHKDALIEEMDYFLNSRYLFSILKEEKSENLTDLQKASKFLYLIKTSYACKTTSYSAKPREVSTLYKFKDIQERLKKVIIENRSFEDLIKVYDTKNSLFYCDPPYYKTEKYYNHDIVYFKEEDHIHLKKAFKGIEGKFVLSYNDCDFIRDLYKEFEIIEIERVNSLAINKTGKDKLYKELIVKNY